MYVGMVLVAEFTEEEEEEEEELVIIIFNHKRGQIFENYKHLLLYTFKTNGAKVFYQYFLYHLSICLENYKS